MSGQIPRVRADAGARGCGDREKFYGGQFTGYDIRGLATGTSSSKQ
jgi:hypothetical protein